MNTEKKKKILIVEDDRALRMILQDKLARENFAVFVASDGAEGLKIAEKELPDIVLLDIIMPKMSGVDMLKLMRETTWGKTVPVLFLTNDNKPERMMEALKINANDYLIKSDWGLAEIITKIKETIRV